MDEARANESRAQEPAWLVRVVLVLFLVGFAAYLGRQAWLTFHG